MKTHSAWAVLHPYVLEEQNKLNGDKNEREMHNQG